ncbi:MAG: ROK family protein, partial [Chloroflexota bacterium]
GDCLEGLATGPAIAARWGKKGESFPPDHPAWQLEANYLALGLANLVTILSPQRILLGGGVMDQKQLFPLIRSRLQEILADYIHAREILEQVDHYVLPPELGSQAGVLGAIALAQRAAKVI